MREPVVRLPRSVPPLLPVPLRAVRTYCLIWFDTTRRPLCDDVLPLTTPVARGPSSRIPMLFRSFLAVFPLRLLLVSASSHPRRSSMLLNRPANHAWLIVRRTYASGPAHGFTIRVRPHVRGQVTRGHTCLLVGLHARGIARASLPIIHQFRQFPLRWLALIERSFNLSAIVSLAELWKSSDRNPSSTNEPG